MSEIDNYVGANLTVINDGKRCIHSRYCVLNLNSVFLPDVDGPWIKPDAASREAVIAVVEKCPSGALRYDGEQPPTVNSVRIWENGPLAFHGELDIAGDKSSLRATLCRCGHSKRKPFCDHSHVEAGFTATGEPAAKASTVLAARNGPLKITPGKDGPLTVEGNLEICTASGRTIARETKTWLCRCGHSANKPFCDGSHRKAGFKDEGTLPND
ncbi:MAG TPA: CDGSH iron-sulfur domain-containing protein [Rhizomicrobium sp.]|jgi:CDGSH-type Zn-finger protein|nr:CDGSH iron-sulfur domain-containing protein [Rhizomicrobium sp.]